MGLIGILFARKINPSSRRIIKPTKRRRAPWLEALENRCLLSSAPLTTLSATEAANVVAQYEQIPLSFVPNAGQMAAPIQFSASGSGYSLFLTATGADFALQAGTSAYSLLQMQLVGANPSATGVGLDQAASTSNFFTGQDPSQWRSSVANFARVQIADVYPGVGLTYYGNQNQLEYDFNVAAGADPNLIQLSFAGAQTSLDGQGNLIVQIAGGDLVEHAPVLYQMAGNQKVPVVGSYVLGQDDSVHFQVGSYDHSQPLVIDPVLSYATYLGGAGVENAQAVAVDAAGNVYITGSTGSASFPTQAALQGQLAGQENVFVAKMNSTGTGLVYSTYVGGGGLDLGLAIRIDQSGNAYIAGTTNSGNFPTRNAIQGTSGGGSDAFVFELNPGGSQLVFSTFLGGSGVEFAEGLALDASNNIYVVGFTHSTDFPTLNAVQSAPKGGQEAWVAKIANSGTSLIYSTYLGGSQDDSAQAVGVDSSGDVYVAGDTYSPDFPVKNSLQSYGGGGDAFVTELNPTGSAILFSTDLGGSGSDRANAVRLDSAGDIYVAGSTASVNFPTQNALQPTFGGNTDVFVTKLNPGGGSIAFSTYLGGSDVDQAASMAIDSNNDIYLVGSTASTNFPTKNPAQATIGGSGDAFVVKLSSNGSTLLYSSYFGGSGDDRASGVAVDGLGNLYVAGTTASANFPTLDAFQAQYGGNFDGFVVKLSQIPATQLSISAPTTSAGNSFSVTVTALDSAGKPASDYTGTIHFTSSDFAAVLPASYTFTGADNGTHTFTGVQLKTVGTQSMTATDVVTSTIAGTQSGIVVTAAVSSFTLSGLPSTVTAGVANSITITARDAQNNVAIGYTGMVHFTTSDSRGVLPADYQFLPSDHGVHTFSGVVLKSAGTQSITVADTTLAKVQGAQTGITVISTGSLATHLAIAMATVVNSGSFVSVTVTALDLTNALAGDYRGTIHFTSTDGSALLPADYTFTEADQGSHAFRVALVTQQPESLTIADTVKASITGTVVNIQVHLAVGSLFLATSLSSTVAGTPFTLTITAEDVLNGLAVGYQGTVHFTTNDNFASLPADYTFTEADQGAHTFPVTFNTGGFDFVSVTDTVNSAIHGTINVAVTSFPKSVILGGLGKSVAAGSPQAVSITIADANGAPVPNYFGTIHFASSDPLAGLPANYTFVPADLGKHTFQVTFNSSGTQSLTATDTTTSSLTGTGSDSVQSVAGSVIFTGLAQTVPAGVPETVTATIVDSNGKTVTGYLGTLHFTSNDSLAALPADYPFSAADLGVHTFQVTFNTGGAEFVTATDTANTALNGTANVTVTSVPKAVVLSGLGQTVSAGSSQNLTVTVVDTNGNPVLNYVGTIHFTSSDGQAVLPANYTFQATDQGTHMFTTKFNTGGAQTITAQDVANSSLTARASVNVVVSATRLVVTSAASTVAGVDLAVTVTAQDDAGRIATSYTGSVSITSTDGKAQLTSSYTFTSADHGTKTFSNDILETANDQSISAQDVHNSNIAVGIDSILVVPGAVASMTFTGEPITGVSGKAMSPAVAVTLFDAFGNLATNSTNSVSLVLVAKSQGPSLGGDTSVTPVNGVAAFPDLVVAGFGTGLVLQAESGAVVQDSVAFNSVSLSAILPVVVAPVIFGPPPNTSVVETYIKGVYRTLLGRDADPSGLNFWVSQINGGTARSAIIDSFWNSSENRGREVDAYYQAYLGRQADPQGRAFWIGQLQNQVDETAIVDSFLLSPEELQASNSVFVTRLYQGALGRTASSGEINFWLGQLANGETRQQVAASFVFSPEAAGVAIDSYYGAYLQRQSDPGGRAFWVNRISNQLASYASVAKSILASDEFFTNAANATS